MSFSAAAAAPPRSAFGGRYLVAAAIDYGRFSNARASLAELVALAVALNRTAVAPPLECCRETSKAAAALFDTGAFAAPTLSAHAFDFEAACGAFDGSGGGGGANSGAPTWLYADSGASAFMTEEPSAFRGHMPARLPGATLLEALGDGVAGAAACVVLSKHFRAVDWAASARPDALAAAQARLLPHASIAAEARSFLARRGLLQDEGAGAALHVRPFVGVHLRQTDFLRPHHRSFATACNEDSELLLAPVLAAARAGAREAGGSGGSGGAATPIGDVVLATDDYETPCARAVLAAFPAARAHALARAALFPRGSCEEALLDQEVLGLAARFVGDAKSTFSEAVAAIRLHRAGFAAETTQLLEAPA